MRASARISVLQFPWIQHITYNKKEKKKERLSSFREREPDVLTITVYDTMIYYGI